MQESIPQKMNASARVVKRCEMCSKKLGLTVIGCKCARALCAVHRYPEEHACTFDFKTPAQDWLRAGAPVIAPPKLERI
jgi:predicted nucleic acid binding AN1-type Zn finger protein